MIELAQAAAAGVLAVLGLKSATMAMTALQTAVLKRNPADLIWAWSFAGISGMLVHLAQGLWP